MIYERKDMEEVRSSSGSICCVRPSAVPVGRKISPNKGIHPAYQGYSSETPSQKIFSHYRSQIIIKHNLFQNPPNMIVQAPSHLKNLLYNHSLTCSLRSSCTSLLLVPHRTKHRTWGDGAFWRDAPSIWKSLPQYGVAVAEGIEWLSPNLKVNSSIPSLPKKSAICEVSLSKMLNPELCLIEQQSAANRCTVWMCVWLGDCKTVLWSAFSGHQD